ncbi:MAG: ParA family protein [Candidatus Eremiobacteraeota bacterium]|nr:ParA family protein [Candidatus Eremiobacteraeota bacterium]
MIVSIINNKGGTGKTTTAVNLAAAMAHEGHKVLICDLDPQASASLSVGVEYHRLTPSLFEILFFCARPEECIRKTSLGGLDILTGSIDLASADLHLADVPGRELVLSEALSHVRHLYDFIVIDCAPSLSLLQINALTACERYVIPLLPEYLTLEGLVSLRDALDRIKSGIGVNPRLLGIVFTMVNPAPFPFLSRELREQTQIMNLLREYAPGDIFSTVIRRDIALAEAPSYGKTIIEYAPGGRSAREFLALSRELIERIKY